MWPAWIKHEHQTDNISGWHNETLINNILLRKGIWLAQCSSHSQPFTHHTNACICPHTVWPQLWLTQHKQYVWLCEWMQADPQQHTLWTESRAKLVWHLWRAWDNLHDTATDSGGDIDLKSGSSKIRFPCVAIGPEACTSVVIWSHGQSCV